MTRFRLNWRVPVLAGGFLLGLLATLPLRVAVDWVGLGERGLSASEVRGSVWSGALDGARLGGVALGDVAARLSALPLLVGEARLDLERRDDGFAGAFTASRHAGGVEDVSGSLTGAVLAGLPGATLGFEDFGARFRDGLCDHAEGRVTAVWMSASFSGEPRCEGAQLRLPLASGRSRIDLSISADGSYRADVAMPPYSGRIAGAF